jgi:hypothetical protein
MATKKAAPSKKAAPKAERPAPEKKRELKPEINAKLANPDLILKKYDDLIDTLAKVESQQRNSGKPYRIYFMHRKRMEVMKMNFIKSMR